MKTSFLFRFSLLAAFLFTGLTMTAQKTMSNKAQHETQMKTYLIERVLPGAGQLSQDDLVAISQKSCTVLDGMGPKIKWMHSYVVADKIYCVYQAENEELLREHGLKGGFPVTMVMEVGSTISPATARL
jgi:hypothetical protein